MSLGLRAGSGASVPARCCWLLTRHTRAGLVQREQSTGRTSGDGERGSWSALMQCGVKPDVIPSGRQEEQHHHPNISNTSRIWRAIQGRDAH
jgi:hypothetical protein